MKKYDLMIFSMMVFLHGSSQIKVLSNLPKAGKSYQSFIPRGYGTLSIIKGDLNKDGIEDVVLALKSKEEEYKPEATRILLMLLKKGNSYHLAGKSSNALLCKGCGGIYGDPFESVEIKNGVVLINHYGGSAWRWASTEKFRYQNDGFYLIGSTGDSYWLNANCNDNITDGAKNYIDVNYITGEQEIIERDENCKLIKHLKNKIKIKPLVKLEDF